MKWVTHKNFGMRPMLIVEDSTAREVVHHIWYTSTSVDQVQNKIEDLHVKDLDVCNLDPGGILFGDITEESFTIDNYKFKVQHDKVAVVKGLMEQGQERVPGYIRFPMWLCLIIMPKATFEKVYQFICELMKTDRYLHSQLDLDNIIEKLDKTKVYIQRDIPRENLPRSDSQEKYER